MYLGLVAGNLSLAFPSDSWEWAQGWEGTCPEPGTGHSLLDFFQSVFMQCEEMVRDKSHCQGQITPRTLSWTSAWAGGKVRDPVISREWDRAGWLPLFGDDPLIQ